MRWTHRRSARWWRSPALLGAILAALAYVGLDRRTESPDPTASSDERIARLYADRISGALIEGVGTVDRVLPDDQDGSRHQRFILRLTSGHTLLVSHNIDLAPRLSGLAPGDRVAFRGQYEWNSQGGVVHWTHPDPDGRHPGGWIEIASPRKR